MSVRTITTRLAIDGEQEFKKQMSAVNNELRTLKSEMKLADAEFKGQANSLAALTAKDKLLRAEIEQQTEKVRALEQAVKDASEAYGETDTRTDKYRQQLNSAKAELANLNRSLDENGKYLEEAKYSFDGCATSIDEYGNEVKKAKEESQDFGEGSKQAFDGLAQALAAAGLAKSVKEIADALMQCVSVAAGFESGMATVAAVSGASEEELARLTETAKQYAASSVFTAQDVASAYNYMAMAGWDASEMLGGLNGIMSLASASGEDLGTVCDIVTDALTAFGLSAEDSAHFADILAQTSASANTNVSLMGETFKYVAPVAGALGYSAEDAAIAIGLMANSGIKASSAGTALRSLLSRLADPTDEVAEAMNHLGISLTDDEGNMLSLMDVMTDLRRGFSRLSEAEAAETASALAGANAMSGLLAIVNSSEADWNKLSDAIDNCGGAAQRMSDIKLDTYEGQVKLLESATEALEIAVGDQLTPALGNLAETGADVLSWAADFIGKNEAIVPAVAAVTAVLSVLTAGVAGYTVTTKAAIPAITAFNAALAMNPAGAAALGITAALAALTALIAFTRDDAVPSVNELTEVTEDSKKAFEAADETYSNTAASVKGNAELARAYVKQLGELEGQVGDSEEAQRRYGTTVDALNQLYPELNLCIDKNTGLVEQSTDAILAQIDAYEALYLEQALQEKYNAELKAYADIEAEVYANKAKLNGLETEHSALVERQSSIYERQMQIAAEMQAVSSDRALSYEEEDAALTRLQTEYDALGAELSAVGEQLRQNEKAQKPYNKAIEKGEEAAGAYQQTVDDARAALEAFNADQDESRKQAEASAAATNEMTSRVKTLTEEMEALEGAYVDAWDAAYDSIDRQLGLFKELDGTAQRSIDDLIKTLSGQVDYMNTYAENIQKAMDLGVNQGLVQKLSDGSEESAQILAAIVEGGENKIAELNGQFAKVEEGKAAFSETVAAMKTDFDEKMSDLEKRMHQTVDELNVSIDAAAAGAATIQGYIDGAESMRDDVTAKFQSLAQAGKRAYAAEMDQHSPSRAFFKMAQDTVKGAVMGVEQSTDELVEAIAEMGSKVKDKSGKQADELFSQCKEYIARETKYRELSLKEQLRLWEAAQDQFLAESKQYADAEEKIFDLKQKVQEEYYKKVKEINGNITALEKEYQDALDERTKAIFSSYRLFEQIPEREKVAGEALVENLRGQISGIQEFYDGLKTLTERGVGDALVSEIREMGPDAIDELDALLALSDEKLAEYASLYAEKQALANDLAMEELADLRNQTNEQIQSNLDALAALYAEDAPNVGKAFTDGLADGILHGMPDVEDAALKVAMEAAIAAEAEFKARSKRISQEIEDMRIGIKAAMASFPTTDVIERYTAPQTPAVSAQNSSQSSAAGSGIAQTTRVEINYTGNLAQIARLMQPEIKAETDRQGPSFVGG